MSNIFSQTSQICRPNVFRLNILSRTLLPKCPNLSPKHLVGQMTVDPKAHPSFRQGHSKLVLRWPDIVHMAQYLSVIWQPALITTQALLFLSVIACHSLKRAQADPLYLSENLIS